jgi:sulfide:quinone oxidoreductase
MVETKPLTDGMSVSAQIRPEDAPALAGTFRTVVNNRPDGVEPGQPTSAELEAAVRKAGMDYAFIPVTPGQFTDQEVLALGQVMADASHPLLAFCRTGTRSATLWALSQAGHRDAGEILRVAAEAGYDLNALKPRLTEEAGSA